MYSLASGRLSGILIAVVKLGFKIHAKKKAADKKAAEAKATAGAA